MAVELMAACSDDEIEVKDLLAECGLPHEDIVAGQMEHFLILRDDLLLAGVIGLEVLGTLALLRSLAVAIPYRNQGHGSRLIRGAEDYARTCGVDELYLLTDMAGDLFARHGYLTVHRESVPWAVQQTLQFRSLCPASALCMFKRLVG